MNNWISVESRLPYGHNEVRPLEMEVIGFNEKWIHPDFNPNGTRICIYSDMGWSCARWNDSQDSWITDWEDDERTKDVAPTHWTPMVERPF